MKRKFILFIVEGTNDAREVNAILHSKYFEKYLPLYDIRFIVQGGDITADNNNKTAGSVRNILDTAVLDFRRNSGPYRNISPDEIQEVVQIVDLDGAFIKGSKVIKGDVYRYQYEDDCIIANNADRGRERNNRKSEIMRKLVQAKTAGGVPYSIYFVSCNMDHLLFNKRNPSQKEKDSDSVKFALLGDAIEDVLRQTLFMKGIMSEGDYDGSWEEIQLGTNSLGRHTNFNLYFDECSKNPK